MDGIILIDKPAGPTSADVVRQVKWRVKPARVGHLGTLDPFATGILPILVGEATKLAPFLHDGEKYYDGLIALGAETDTLDRTGEVTRTATVAPFDEARLRALAASFTGTITQTPPIFSAIKRAGVPLYKLARRGGEVAPPPPREVTISRLALTAEGADAIRFSMTCSPGTYVRSLARDLGIALGGAAHLAELRRTRNGQFSIDDAHPLDEVLAALEGGDGAANLIGLRAALPDLPDAPVDPATAARLRNGDSRALDGLIPPHAKFFKVIAGGRLLAVAEATSRMTAVIARVFSAGSD
ncbi:MAG TPA: tRNA pseudouridine(55) synthase TruB [Candidatus Binataceae bacterium]|jgi:tRNA pseudouridine55 synthase|nr:tRNA pseudouridine(55) synthase TruB [Candidatus Binataceae bacterium]